jgi:hypothetical protein
MDEVFKDGEMGFVDAIPYHANIRVCTFTLSNTDIGKSIYGRVAFVTE